MARTSNNSNKSNRQPSQTPNFQSYQQDSNAEYTKEGALKFGNQDKKKQHDLSELKIRPDHVVVRHFSVFNSPGGAEMEDPASSRIQVYEQEVYDRMTSQKKDKVSGQTLSEFERQGLGVQVLHKPE
jgi:hypothetical protein